MKVKLAHPNSYAQIVFGVAILNAGKLVTNVNGLKIKNANLQPAGS